MSTTPTIQTLEILSISSALLASGGIAAFSLFCIPPLKSQPASRSLPTLRWLFSRGSHIFPTAGILSSSTFAYLSWACLAPSAKSSLSWETLLRAGVSGKPGYFLAAAALSISIAPITSVVLVPTNFTLIRKNEALGGARSAASAAYRAEEKLGPRSAEASVDSRGDVSQWRDGSGPQEVTQKESSDEEDREVGRLLDRFARLNMLRAVAIGAGGVVGLMGALA